MVQKIKSSIITLLTVLNIIGIILIFISISQYNDSYSYNRRLSKKNYNYTNFSEKQYKLSQTNNTNILKEKQTKQKLSPYTFSKNYFITIFILNFLLIYFCLSLLFSFCVGDNECECNSSCCRCCCDGGCGGCECRNGDNGSGIIACLILILIIVIIYFSTKLCGKHLSRYISLSFISFVYFLIFIISLLSFNGDNPIIKYNILISTSYLICNLSGMILPNLKQCENLRYESNPPPIEVINFPQYPQMQNNRIAINVNNSYNNNQRDTINNVPIVRNEYNHSFPQDQTTESYIGNNPVPINSINSSVSQNSVENENLGNAPLPIDELPSERDINSVSEKKINSTSTKK